MHFINQCNFERNSPYLFVPILQPCCLKTIIDIDISNAPLKLPVLEEPNMLFWTENVKKWMNSTHVNRSIVFVQIKSSIFAKKHASLKIAKIVL